ncbi:glycosyltransferase family 25 protein [Neisseriaceae bacterium ESL0693]|nr:glycosyltransferase family 25 protein [Neisseriaceae bacterium ESL0693]
MLKTFLINLDRRIDRFEFVKQQLDKLDIGFERISAIDGQFCSAEQIQIFNQNKFLLQCKRQVVRGEMGCALSHRSVWQRIVDEQIPYALILEDDIDIDPRLKSVLSQPEYYQKFDFLNLALKEPYELRVEDIKTCTRQQQWIRPYFWQSRRSWHKIENKSIVPWRIFNIHALDDDLFICECDPAPALACCYIVSLKAAKSFLDSTETIFYPIDKVWHHSGGLLKQAVLSEAMALQIADSDIQNRSRLKLSSWQRVKRFLIKSRRWQRRLDVIRLYGWARFF